MTRTLDVKPVVSGAPYRPIVRTGSAPPTHQSAGTPDAPPVYEVLLAWLMADGAAQQVVHVLWMTLLLFLVARRLLMRRSAPQVPGQGADARKTQ
jgi:hypothetical protein